MKRLRLSAALACAAALLAALPALAPASVQVGSSGWQWGNPLPQGNTLRAMSFAGASGYAAGDFGTLLRTTDGGTTWSGLLSGTFTNLTEVQAIDADSSSPRAAASRGARTTAAPPSRASPSRRSSRAARSSSPPAGSSTAGTGFLVAHRRHGPAHRQQRRHLRAEEPAARHPRARAGRRRPIDLRFLTDQIGVGATSDGKIYRTTDGGNSWSLVSDTNRAVRSFVFLDAKNGFAVGDGSLFLDTSDGGATWTPKDIGIPPTNLRSIRCASPSLRDDHRAGRPRSCAPTTAARRATLVTPSPDPILAAAFASPTRIAAGGATGATAVSDDAGLNFTPVGGRLSGTYSRVRAGGQTGTAFAPGRQRLAGQDDRRRQDVDARQRLDLRGRRSTSPSRRRTSATPWTRRAACSAPTTAARPGGRSTPAPPRGRSSSPRRRRSTVMLVGPTGMRRSTDGGDTFSTVTGKDVVEGQARRGRPRRQRALRLGPPRPAALDRRGKTWRALHKPAVQRQARAPSSRSTSSTPERVLPGRGRRAVAHRQRRASTWTALPGVGTDTGLRHRVLVEDPGLPGHRSLRRRRRSARASCCKTTTAARPGTRSSSSPTPIPARGIAAAAGGTDYLLGGESSLLFTTTGGEAGKASALSVDDQAPEAQQAGGHHRHRPAVARRGQRARDGQLPAAGLGPLAAPDGQDRGQRRVHDELARAPRAATASSPSGRATSAPRATARAC